MVVGRENVALPFGTVTREGASTTVPLLEVPVISRTVSLLNGSRRTRAVLEADVDGEGLADLDEGQRGGPGRQVAELGEVLAGDAVDDDGDRGGVRSRGPLDDEAGRHGGQTADEGEHEAAAPASGDIDHGVVPPKETRESLATLLPAP